MNSGSSGNCLNNPFREARHDGRMVCIKLNWPSTFLTAGQNEEAENSTSKDYEKWI